ncbi:HigA family addiction module antitoxin [Rhizobium puerariae]|uniref:HigA family addiction module antitoxin n=1 Tax=Rhizobium puerariae TaxID=1585791 RepID=A0ABV6AK53_9HYPH
MTLLGFAIHPGEILDEEFLKPLNLSAGALAKRLGVPRTRIERLVKEDTALTADTALRLSAFFGNTPEFWLNLQRSYDLIQASKTVDVSHIQPLPVPPVAA